VERTRRIIEAMREAAAEGKGAVSLDGRLIDAASIRMAENLLAKLEQIEALNVDTPQLSAAAPA
jgi:malyl-CoA/(S)-citramalyl-CoA lyase